MNAKKYGDVNFYDLLGISIECEQVDIRKAYRRKALACHPDKHPDNPKAAELFHELAKALEILTDVTARAAYDKVLRAKQAAELRTKQLDSKWRNLKADLEQRERSYSFTPIHLKKTNLILRGLLHNTDIEDIKQELEVQIPGIVEEVKQFETKYSREHNTKTGLFLVTLNVGHSMKDVAKVKQILYQVISWEKPHSSNKIIQCKRCQKWGHIAKNCNRPYTCVKCDETHGPGECRLPRDKDNKSFSSLFNNNQNNAPHSAGRPNHKSDIIKNFMAIAKDILGEQAYLEIQIDNFLRNRKDMSLEEQRKRCILLLNEIKDSNC